MSVREFYSHPTRWLAESIMKESVFEKPYLDEDRGRMHNDLPIPDWPSFPPLPPLPGPIPGPVPGLDLCAITCYAPSDCDEPIWCHPSIWCGTDLGCTLCSWVVEGATSGYTPHLSGVGSWGIDIWIDDELIELSPREVSILELMYKSSGKPVSRDRFLDVCWGLDYEYSRTLDTHIANLRKKIEVDVRTELEMPSVTDA